MDRGVGGHGFGDFAADSATAPSLALSKTLLPSFSQLSGNIGIFGGTFDPIHTGHVDSAAAAQEQFGFSGLVFIPAAQNPDKDPPKAQGKDRLAMIAEAIHFKAGWFVSDLEVRRGGHSRTVETLREISAQLKPGAKLHLLMGLDCLAHFDRWEGAEEIASLANLVPIRRGHNVEFDIDAINPRLSRHIRRMFISNYVPGNAPPFSSGEVRAATLRHDSGNTAWQAMLPESVVKYVIRNGLYQVRSRAAQASEINQSEVDPFCEIRGLWDEMSGTWRTSSNQRAEQFKERLVAPEIKRLLGDVTNQQILDAGCCDGKLCRELSNAGAILTGIDTSPHMIELAEFHEKYSRQGIAYIIGSCADSEIIGAGKFDRVVSNLAPLGSEELEKSLAAFYAALRPGGELIFSIKHPFTSWQQIRATFDESGQLELAVPESYFETERIYEPVDITSESVVTTPTTEGQYATKTVSDYINALSRAGFRLVESSEPKPTEDMCKETPYFKPYTTVPYALILKAEKPV